MYINMALIHIYVKCVCSTSSADKVKANKNLSPALRELGLRLSKFLVRAKSLPYIRYMVGKCCTCCMCIY
ncbi:hypothetical protein XELAEV_18004665mg [Xenopus laevis]|uniref:Uncharacterized protein n=1 Tax=Xenopus laevis TaxID=8355 RepID=A0A974GY27_XENLA|nr:hypothetical protein XELAEV_18004665mg [Xenopus laevis]